MDIDTFFDQIRQNLIDLISRELTDLNSARVQTTECIRFIQSLEDDFGNVIGVDRVSLPFNCRIMDIFQGSDSNTLIEEMFSHTKTQIGNPAFASPEESYTEVIDYHIPSGFCVNSEFAYGKVENPIKLYRGKDCIEVFCDYISNEARRLYHMFPEKPMEHLTCEQ